MDFVNDLHGHLFPRYCVLHLGKCTLGDGFEKPSIVSMGVLLKNYG